MPIPVTCPQCQSTFRVKDHLAGRRGKCPRCGGVIQVPAPNQPSGAAGAAEPEAAGSSLGPSAGVYEALDQLDQQSPATAPGAAFPGTVSPGKGVPPGAAPSPGAPGPAAPYPAGAFPGAMPPRRQGVPAWVWIAGGAGVLVVLCLVGGILILGTMRQAGLAKREAERVQAEHGEFGTGTTVRLGGEMVSEQEARTFAQKLLPVIGPHMTIEERINRIDPLLQLKSYVARTLQTREVLLKSDPRFEIMARHTVLTLVSFLRTVRSFEGVTLVRVQQRDGYRSLLLRTNDDDPEKIHYTEVLLIKEQGTVKILDMYSYRFGVYVSELTRWELLRSASVKKPEDTLVRLPAKQFVLVVKHREALMELIPFQCHFISSYKHIRDDYESLPPEVQKWRIVQVSLLWMAAEDANAEPFPRIAAQFQKLFPKDPVLLFACLKNYTYFRREDPEKVCQVLGQLAQELGDPYLLLVQGRYALKKKLHDEALAGFQAALEQSERPEEQNQARIGLAQIYLLKKDYPRLLEMMTQLRKHDRRPWDKIESEIKDADFSGFSQFRSTPEYKQWKEEHLGGSP